MKKKEHISAILYSDLKGFIEISHRASDIDAVKIIKEKLSDVDTVILTIRDDGRIFLSLTASAGEDLETGIEKNGFFQQLLEGHQIEHFVYKDLTSNGTDSVESLTVREREVLQGLADDKTYQKIADDLHISFETVRSHIKNVYRKLSVNNSGGAVAKALRENLI